MKTNVRTQKIGILLVIAGVLIVLSTIFSVMFLHNTDEFVPIATGLGLIAVGYAIVAG